MCPLTSVDRVSFTESALEAYEDEEVLKLTLTLTRPSSELHDVIVTVRTRDLMIMDSAKGLLCVIYGCKSAFLHCIHLNFIQLVWTILLLTRR